MLKLTKQKKAAMDRLSTKNGLIEALAIDQRGALKRMMGTEIKEIQVEAFKKLVAEDLTPFASSILLDPEYGLPAAKVRSENAGLLLAYEKTGYDASMPGRLPDLLQDWSVLRLKNQGADAIKFLLYYDIDEDSYINHLKHVFVERLGNECLANDLPFYLELVSYDTKIKDTTSTAYAKIKPHKVIQMMKEFSKEKYKVDVLKVEVPVNMNYVEEFGTEEIVYTKETAANYFKEQSEATNLPFIFLSAGVSIELFKKTLLFAREANSSFNGVLCGRATWRDGVTPFIESGNDLANQWFQTEGKNNIQSLNEVVEKTATSWHEKVIVEG